MALGLIGRDGGLSTLCHRCGFDCQQRVLKKNKKNKKNIYIYITQTVLRSHRSKNGVIS